MDKSFSDKKLKGGEEASSLSPNRHSSRLVRVRYKDSILFWNSDPRLYDRLNFREAVGWLEVETDALIRVVFDRSVKVLPHEKRECGLTISKPDIVDIREIRKPY